MPIFQKGLIKGTPTAVLVSVAIHVILLFLAGTWVVFTIIDKKDPGFVPVERHDRPKMQLKKLRVKIKENTKPRQSTQRIVAKSKQAMPDIQLPEMSGIGGGLSGGIGGFEMMADLSSMTLFGGSKSIGNDLVGTLYDLKRNSSGGPSGIVVSTSAAREYWLTVNEFLEKGWDASVFSRFYRAPKKLYAIHFMLPPFASDIAMDKFGMTGGYEGSGFVVHYKGKIAHPQGGKFRFWGHGDDILLVRINKKLVLNGQTLGTWNSDQRTPENWKSSDPDDRRFYMGIGRAVIGDWFELEPGVPVEMELLLGDYQGGRTSAMLNVQEFGVDYPKNEQGMPILPAFKTAKIPQHIIDEITYMLVPDETDLEGGPLFSVY